MTSESALLDAVLPAVGAPTRARLGAIAEVARAEAGAPLVVQGARSAGFTALLTGVARTTRRTDAEHPAIMLDVLRGPCLLPDVSAWSPAPSPYAITAMRPCLVARIPIGAFGEAAAQDPALAAALGEVTASAVLAMVRRVEDVAVGTVEQRLVRLLDDLAERYGSPVGQGRFIGLPMRRRDVASLIGATIETVSRLFARYEREGLVRTAQDGIWWSLRRTERNPR